MPGSTLADLIHKDLGQNRHPRLTFCCINCIHTLPDLAKLEKKYERTQVIGVHSATREQKNTEAIRKAVTANRSTPWSTAHMKIWASFASAPADDRPHRPEGNFVRFASGMEYTY